MQTYELLVEGRSIRSNSADNTLVRTSIGMDRIHVLFDSAEWLSFPLTVTFAQDGVNPVTASLPVSEISGSGDWHAEGTVTVPYEVITMVGPIRVTFQGTDSQGNHIITAYGAPLEVEEAGDVTIGDIPADAPTVDEWNQAYADAVAAAADARSLVSSLQSQIADIVEAAQAAIDQKVDIGYLPATSSRLGVIQVGEGLGITEGGTLYTLETNGITAEQANQITNLALLASYAFDTTFSDETGWLDEGVKLKGTALKIDGKTLKLTDDGILYVDLPNADTEVY